MIRLRGLPARALEAVLREATAPNPEVQRARRAGMPAKHLPPRIDLWEQDDSGAYAVPRGLTRVVRTVFAAHGLAPRWDDRRVEAPLPEPVVFSGDDRAEQGAVVEECVRAQNLIVLVPGGGGKTPIGGRLIAALGHRALVIVGKKALLKQWARMCKEMLRVRPRLIGGGHRVDRGPLSSAVTIAIEDSLREWRVWEEAPYFGLVIVDECAHVAARTWSRVVGALPAKWRVGMTEDETRDDQAEQVTYAHLGRPRVASTVSRGELVAGMRILPTRLLVWRTGWVPRDELDLPIPPRAINPTERTTMLVRDPGRNDQVVRAILESMRGEHTGLVLTHRVEHAEWLRGALWKAGLECGLLVGGREADFDRTAESLRSGRLRIAAATIGSVGEGFDVPRLDRGYIVCAGARNRQALGQMLSRFTRTHADKGATPPDVYYFADGVDDDPGLTDPAEVAEQRGWARSRIAGIARLVAMQPDRFRWSSGEPLMVQVRELDGTWRPLRVNLGRYVPRRDGWRVAGGR